MKLKDFNYTEDGEYIYLVMVEYKDKTLLKIGYTKTLDNRMDTYELHNPDIQLLKIREGTRELENYMHKKFEKYAYPKRKEWFYYNEEIIKNFDVLDEKNFLDIDKLKNKIYNLLKPKSIEDLKKLYYERYQKEINNEDLDKEDLDILITDSFSFINKTIENFINNFDYSEIPLELDLNTSYQLVIPSPIDSMNISMDLEQILGRQRREDNLWKNTATMFVKTTRIGTKTTWEEFKEKLDKKENKTISLLRSYSSVPPEDKHNLAEKYQKDARVSHYKDDYVAVNEHAGIDIIPVFNKLMMISEMRAFEMQQVDYSDRFSVINTVQTKGFTEEINKPICELAKKFIELIDVVSKLQFIVALADENLTKEELNLFFSLIPNKYKDYYDILGFEGIRAHKYKESEIKREIERLSNNYREDQVKEEIYCLFKVGCRYTNKDIKDKLRKVYEKLDYQKTAKAIDIGAWFITKTVKLQDSSGKWTHGLELLKNKL